MPRTMKLLLLFSLVLSVCVALPTSKDGSLSAEDMRRVLEAVREALPVPKPAEANSAEVLNLVKSAMAQGRVQDICKNMTRHTF